MSRGKKGGRRDGDVGREDVQVGRNRSEGLCKASQDRPGSFEAAGQTIKSVPTSHTTYLPSRANTLLPWVGM